MLDLVIMLATLFFALIVAYARFDLLSTYYIAGAIYAVGVGVLLGNQPESRIRGYRLHLWIAGICACFVVMWHVAGIGSFSGQKMAGISAASAAQMMLPRVALLYLGIYLAWRASGQLSTLFGAWLDIFLKTPTESFIQTRTKVSAMATVVLFVTGVWFWMTGDLPGGLAVVKDLVGSFRN